MLSVKEFIFAVRSMPMRSTWPRISVVMRPSAGVVMRKLRFCKWIDHCTLACENGKDKGTAAAPDADAHGAAFSLPAHRDYGAITGSGKKTTGRSAGPDSSTKRAQENPLRRNQ